MGMSNIEEPGSETCDEQGVGKFEKANDECDDARDDHSGVVF